MHENVWYSLFSSKFHDEVAFVQNQKISVPFLKFIFFRICSFCCTITNINK